MAVTRIAAALSALFIAAGAHATSSVSASLSDFSMTVSQGSLSWSNGAEDMGLFVRLYANSSDVSVSPVNDVMSFAGFFGDASLSAAGTVSNGSAAATATSLSISLSTPAAGGSAYAFASWVSHFDLASNSSVTFSWTVHNSGTFLTSGDNNGAYSEVAFGDEQSGAMVAGKGYWSNFTYAYQVDGVGYQFWSAGGKEYATVTAGSQGASNVGFFARVQGHTVDSVSAVPEPESVALALAGLGVVGVVATRRRRAA